MKISPQEFEQSINQSIFITYKLSQHIVRSSFTKEQEIDKRFYLKNNSFREKLIPILREKNYSIENSFENKQILDNYYEKGKYIATFSFNIHGFNDEEIEKKFNELKDKVKKIKTVSAIKELKETELDIVENLNEKIKYYSKVKHVVIVCDDITTLFILGFRLGSVYVKLNLHNTINLNLSEFQESLNELSQVVYELTSHIVKHKLYEGI